MNLENPRTIEPGEMKEGRLYLTSQVNTSTLPKAKRAARGRSIRELMCADWGVNGSLLTDREQARLYRHLNR